MDCGEEEKNSMVQLADLSMSSVSSSESTSQYPIEIKPDEVVIGHGAEAVCVFLK